MRESLQRRRSRLRLLLAHLHFLLGGHAAAGKQRDCGTRYRDISHRVSPRELFVAAHCIGAAVLKGTKQTIGSTSSRAIRSVERRPGRGTRGSWPGSPRDYLATTTVRCASVKTVNSVPVGITAERPFLVAPTPSVSNPRVAA